MTEDEMAGWHHRINGHESEQTLEMVKPREACAAVADRLHFLGPQSPT